MPAYSFGNRWMGIASLTDPPVLPPLHRLALSRHEAMLRRSSSHLVILPGGEQISRDTTRTALARMGRGYALAEQWSKADVCYELGKVLQNQDPQEQAWPAWLLRRILAVARREYGSRPIQRPAAATPEPPHTPRVLPHPPVPIDDIPISPVVLAALDGFGWQPGSGRNRRAWLATALIHVSYLHETETLADEISPALLSMLAAVGASWTTLAALDLQIQHDPSTEAGEQSKKIAGTRTVLLGAIATLLHTDATGVFSKSQQPPVAKATEAVAMQICGVLVLLGDFAALGRIAARAYRDVRDSGLDTRDWRTDLEERLAPDKPSWQCHTEGTDGAPAFTAVVTDARGKTGTGQATSKTEANRLAARDYLTRHHRQATAEVAWPAPIREPRRLRRPPVGHAEAVIALRRTFNLPPEAEPWITQAMLHGSYAYENRATVAEAGQSDNRLLAHHGSHVMEALRAADLTYAVVTRTLTPSAEQGRLGTVAEPSLRPVFDALGMGQAMLRGAGESKASMDAVKPGAVQAMHAVAWRFTGCRLLQDLPAATEAWIEDSDASLDAFAQLDQLCRLFGITLTCSEAADGSGYGARYRATIILTHHGHTAQLLGPPISTKPGCRTAGAAEVLKRLQAASDADGIDKAAADSVGHFLLRAMLHGGIANAGRGLERVTTLRLLGLTHLLQGDTNRFTVWASAAENAIGTLDAPATEAIQTLYTRAVSASRAGEHRALRSRTRQAARDVAAAIATSQTKKQHVAWMQLIACKTVIQTLAAPGSQSLADTVDTWAATIPSAATAAWTVRDIIDEDALDPKETAIIRAVGDAVIAAAIIDSDARVTFDEGHDGAVLTISGIGIDPGEALPDLLGLAVTVAPSLTWKTSMGRLVISLAGSAVGTTEAPGTLAASGIAALRAPAADLCSFAADVETALVELAAAADTPDAVAAVADWGADPVAWAAAARRQLTKGNAEGAV